MSNTQKRRTPANAGSSIEVKLDEAGVKDAALKFSVDAGVPVLETERTSQGDVRPRAASSNINGRPEPVSDRSGLFGALPVPASTITVSLFGQPFVLPAGCIIVHAGTGAGKSITALAMINSLARTAKQDRAGDEFEAYYVSTFEPGSPLIARTTGERQLKSFNDLQRALFYDANCFLEAAEESGRTGDDKQGDLLIYMRGRGERSRRVVLCFDSLTRAVQHYRMADRANQPTFSGGGQPMDVAFFSVLNQYCLNKNITLFAIVNESQLPFSPRFEGATEGVATIPNVGELRLRVRRGGRFDRSFSATQKQLDEAGAALGYPSRDAASASTRNQSIFGA